MDLSGVSARLIALLLLTASAGAARDLSQDWSARIGLTTGPAWVGYGESAGSLDSSFDEVGWWAELSLEANLAGWSPYGRVGGSGASGLERVDGINVQRTDLRLVRVWADLGLGYRLALNDLVTLVPRVGYGFSRFGFRRTHFRVNGTEVVIQGVNGELYSRIDEDFTSHGVTGGLGLELTPTRLIELDTHLDLTFLPRVKVENDLGGTLHSDGVQLRSGASCTFWLLENLGLSVGTELYWQLLDESRVVTRRGSVDTTFVQFPYSETWNLVFALGLRLRF